MNSNDVSGSRFIWVTTIICSVIAGIILALLFDFRVGIVSAISVFIILWVIKND
jgi:hypothetical protein